MSVADLKALIPERPSRWLRCGAKPNQLGPDVHHIDNLNLLFSLSLSPLLAQVSKPTSSASVSTSAPASPAIVTGGRLPLELYGYIISLVDSASTLRQLCLVCEFFCNEGRRRLYNEVDLTMRRISPFAWTVANHPHVARRVRSISITLPSHMVSMNNGEGENIVAIVLRSLTELENLAIYGQPRIQLQKLLDVTSPRLKRFRSSAFICQEVIDSLASKPELRELVTPESYPHFRPVVPESFLPGLETLCLPICLVHHVTKMNWALTHLAIDLSPYRDLESLVPGIVSHFGETLVNLSLVRLVPTQAYRLCPMIDLISEFAPNVPKLKFLTVSVCETLVGLELVPCVRVVPPAYHFSIVASEVYWTDKDRGLEEFRGAGDACVVRGRQRRRCPTGLCSADDVAGLCVRWREVCGRRSGHVSSTDDVRFRQRIQRLCWLPMGEGRDEV